MRPFVLLVIAHVIGDGVLSSSNAAVAKRSSDALRQFRAVGIHAGAHGSVAGLVLWAFYGSPVLGGVLVFLFHFGIDMARCRLEMRVFGADRLVVDRPQGLSCLLRPGSWPSFFREPQHRAWALFNAGDQVAHLGSLILICWLI